MLTHPKIMSHDKDDQTKGYGNVELIGRWIKSRYEPRKIKKENEQSVCPQKRHEGARPGAVTDNSFQEFQHPADNDFGQMSQIRLAAGFPHF